MDHCDISKIGMCVDVCSILYEPCYKTGVLYSLDAWGFCCCLMPKCVDTLPMCYISVTEGKQTPCGNNASDPTVILTVTVSVKLSSHTIQSPSL